MANDGQVMPLGEVAHIVMGLSPKGDTYNNDGVGDPLLNGPTEFGSIYPSATLYTTSPSRFSEPGDILFCVRGSTTGRMNWADRRYAIGRGIAAVRAKTGSTDTYYIYSCINHYLDRLLALTSGSVFPSLSTDDFNSFKIPWPDDNHRRAIVQILRSLDDKIELNRRMNRTLEKIAAAIFKSWFIDFDPVHAKAEGRDPGLPAEIADLFPESFEDSALGPIPKGWKVVTFEELIEAKQGKYIPKKEMKDTPDDNYGVPVWGGNGVRGYTQKCMYPEPVIVLTCRGSNCGLIKLTDSPAWISNIGFACIPKVGSTAFLYVYFRYSSFKDCISGSAQPQITYSALKNTTLSHPVTETLVEAFSKQIEPLFQRIRCNVRQNRRLAGLRDTLLPKLLSGEIELPEAEELVEGGT